MEKSQKIKLVVGIAFIALFTAISAIAYVKILKPIRDGRNSHQSKYMLKGKYTLKGKYKTKINPDIIDSIEMKEKLKHHMK